MVTLVSETYYINKEIAELLEELKWKLKKSKSSIVRDVFNHHLKNKDELIKILEGDIKK